MKEDISSTEDLPVFIPETNEELLSPLQYFTNLFSMDLMLEIVHQTNLYSTQMRGSSANTSTREMTDFVSIVLLMGVIDLPAYEDYWAANTRIEQVASLMPVKRFKLLRRYIHFNDNTQLTEDTNDRYYKVRPLIEKVRKNFRKYHTENSYSIDETMVAYKGTRAGNLRQYIKNKPHKWGYKFFLIAGVSGYILDFIPYQGSLTFDQLKGSANEINEEETKLGVGAAIVIALCKSLHNPSDSTVYFDNYFSSLPLFVYLKDKMKILSLGTLRGNRIGGCPIETDKILSKQGRGKFDFKSDKEKGVIVVKWVDNKCVLLGSTLYGIEPKSTLKRYSKIVKEKVEVECPAIIRNYNKHMGGVDKANALMGLYKTPGKAKRWYFSIFTYILDICVVNAWLLYRMDCVALNKKHMPLKKFRLEISEALSRTGKESRKGRPSSAAASVPKIKNPTVPRPDDTSRTDCFAHWPTHTTKGRCRHCVSGTSRLKCEKCDTRLCLTEKKNCFKAFHEKR